MTTTERPTTRSATPVRGTVPGVFGPIPSHLVPDAAAEHPLTADVPRRPGRWYWRDLIAGLDPVS
ncbi:MAG: hypothetical protein Q4G35_14115, partial [Propionibacteriaceae bacterium]|nr:hypothetical protein [Propionibacteriaceae bacterium]